MTPTCPKCKRLIPGDDINVAKDVAFCRTCNQSYSLSKLTLGAELDENVNLAAPPRGAWYRNNGVGAVIGASHRSLGKAAGVLVFTLFWNGIVSVFVMFAISGALPLLHIPQPHWFPAPKMNGGNVGVGMVIFLWLFLMPFITVGLFMIGTFLLCLWGRTDVLVQGDKGVVFTGIGSLGYRRRFDRSAVKDVRIVETLSNSRNYQMQRQIVLEMKDGRQIKFGSQFPEEKRKFVASATRRALAI